MEHNSVLAQQPVQKIQIGPGQFPNGGNPVLIQLPGGGRSHIEQVAYRKSPSLIPIVLRGDDRTNAAPILLSDGQKMTPKPMIWGFPSFKGKGVIINARGETALGKPMFRRSVLERRCIVPTTGFYEWDSQKRKYHFRLPGQDRLYLAGLWNVFQGEERFVVLTTAPNDTISHIDVLLHFNCMQKQ